MRGFFTILSCGLVQGQEHPLHEDERYLSSCQTELVDYRDHPISDRFVKMADLVDAPPTWIEDLFVPLLIPGSSITVPLNIKIPFSIPGSKIPLPTSFTLINATVGGLNEWKTLRPLKLRKDSRYSWESTIKSKELQVFANAKLTVLKHDVNVAVAMNLTSSSIYFSSVIAFNRTRLCSVWGSTIRSSLGCAVSALANHEELGISGVNITQFKMELDDFDFSLDVTGMYPASLNEQLKEILEGAITAAKPAILANLPTTISQTLRVTANKGLQQSILDMQRNLPCEKSFPAAAFNVSRVCVTNNGLDELRLNLQDCPAHFVSKDTLPFRTNTKKCMDVTHKISFASADQILRVGTQAILGVHEIIGPNLQYAPDSNAAGFECSGFSELYECKFISIAPINPSILPQVSQVCVINHADFLMNFYEQNQRTGSKGQKTKDYLIGEKVCIDLGATSEVTEGDVFQIKVNAVLGFDKAVDRNVEYRDNGLSVAFVCKGVGVDYSCALLGATNPDDELMV